MAPVIAPLIAPLIAPVRASVAGAFVFGSFVVGSFVFSSWRVNAMGYLFNRKALIQHDSRRIARQAGSESIGFFP